MIPSCKNIKFSFLILFLVFLTACAGGRNAAVDQAVSPNLVMEGDEEQVEYDLIIIDPGFQSWYAAHAHPIGFYSPTYYQNWNERYVRAWNAKVMLRPYYHNLNYPFENHIDYDPTVDYPVELNHKLYWYFRYVEDLYGDLYNFPDFAGL